MMKVFFLGRFDVNYPRNKIIRKGLMQNNVTVKANEFNFGSYQRKKILLNKRFGKLSFIIIESYNILLILNLIIKNIGTIVESDIIFIPDFCIKEAIILYPFSKLLRKKLVLDFFVSGYETAIIDRKVYGRKSFFSKYIYLQDYLSLRFSDLVLFDCGTHRKFLKRFYKIRKKKTVVVPIGFDNTRFTHLKGRELDSRKRRSIVSYWGTLIPLHGLEYIAEAAYRLKDEDIIFQLFLPDHTDNRELEKYGFHENMHNVTIIKKNITDNAWVLKSTDLALGIFGKSLKSGLVIPNKLVEAMALGLPVITSETPAAKEFFMKDIHLFFCRRADGKDLAEKIVRALQDPQRMRFVAERGRQYVNEHFSPIEIGKKCLSAFSSM